METNFAKGFVDLNPKYTEMRHKRAVQLAHKWEDRIGDKLLEKHEEVARKNFNDFIDKGNKLSFTELKKLKSNWKSDYVKAQIVESNEVNEYVKGVVDKIEDNSEAV